MNADEYTLFPFDGVTRHWLSAVGDKKPISGYPPEFFAAVCRYADRKFVFQSEIFEGLRKWRE